MSPSKLDPHQKARDFRRTKRRHKRHNEKPPLPVHVDVTSVTYASQLVDDGSRFTVLDALPEMDEEWINEIVYVRSPTTGTPDRAFMGIQNLDDSLVWIEITLAAPAPPNEANEPTPPPVSGTVTYQRRLTMYSATTARDDYAPIAYNPNTGDIWVVQNQRWQSYDVITGAFVTQTAAVTGWPNGVDFKADYSRMYAMERALGSVNSKARVYNGVTQTTSFGLGTSRRYHVSVDGTATYLYIANGDDVRVERMRLSDGVVTDSAGINFATGVCVDKTTGTVYATGHSLSTGNHIVRSDTANFATTNWQNAQVAAATNGRFNIPAGLDLDSGGRLWVCDRDNHRVQALRASDGTYLGQFGKPAGSVPSVDINELTWPTDIVCVGSKLYVMESGTTTGTGKNARVSEWEVAADFPA